MYKSITIHSSFNNVPSEIQLTYTVQLVETVHTISCCVISEHIPNWLQLRKFEITSIHEKQGYVPLFNEINNEKNLATILFIDQVYTNIMKAEKLRVKAFAEEYAGAAK
ncbi:MAG: hypothetical protein ACHQD8_01075 [Chitinophagales bacterium]